MRKSMRSGPNEPQAPRQRPVSYQPIGSKSETTSTVNKNRHSLPMSDNTRPPAAAALIQPSALSRRGSDSSTSSFQRARTAKSAGGGGLGFRKTMRRGTGGGSLDLQRAPRSQSQQQQRDNSSRLSLRAISPPVTMRSTLRGDQRRQSEDSVKGYLRFPGRKSGDKKAGKSTAASRFGDDSSDDEVAGASRRPFRSRFDDSSDEDLTPTKPLPSLGAKTMRAGRNKETPSPPLPEEEEVEMSDAETPGIAGTAAAGDEKVPGITSARSGSGMDATKRQRRGSFMSSVLRRNKKHDSVAKVTRPELMDSAARRDTTLERSANELTALRTGGSSSPKLHKRTSSMLITPNINTSTSQLHQPKDWPLTPAAENADDDKDVFYDAADGGEGSSPRSQQQRSPSALAHSQSQPSMTRTRPGFLTRRTTIASVVTAGTNIDSVAGGKKKKFGALRRMFRLDE